MLVEIDRPQFNELAEKGTLKSYRRAAETGHIKATGDSNVIKLIVQVVEKQEEREPPEESPLMPLPGGLEADEVVGLDAAGDAAEVDHQRRRRRRPAS